MTRRRWLARAGTAASVGALSACGQAAPSAGGDKTGLPLAQRPPTKMEIWTDVAPWRQAQAVTQERQAKQALDDNQVIAQQALDQAWASVS